MLRDTEQPCRSLSRRHGGTKLTLKGQLRDPFQWTGADVELALSGPNLADIYPLLGIPGPPTRPTGSAAGSTRAWPMEVRQHQVARRRQRSCRRHPDRRARSRLLTAKLVSQILAFKDLAPLVGAPPGKAAMSRPSSARPSSSSSHRRSVPNVPLHTERLRAMNMDVTLDTSVSLR
jgi:hypothetical protein